MYPLKSRPTTEELQIVEALLSDPAAKVEDFPQTVVDFLRETLKAQISAQLPTGPVLQALATLKATFDQTATLLGHGLPWEIVEASLAADKEAIPILEDLIARGGQPTVTMEADGEIKWTEAIPNVPLKDFKGIPMSNLAYDEIGESKAPKAWNCRGNALQSAGRIHPRVTLTSKADSEKLAAAGLIQDDKSFPWVYTPDSERGDKNDQYGGLAWRGCDGRVRQNIANYCLEDRGARFSLGVKKIEI